MGNFSDLFNQFKLEAAYNRVSQNNENNTVSSAKDIELANQYLSLFEKKQLFDYNSTNLNELFDFNTNGTVDLEDYYNFCQNFNPDMDGDLQTDDEEQAFFEHLDNIFKTGKTYFGVQTDFLGVLDTDGNNEIDEKDVETFKNLYKASDVSNFDSSIKDLVDIDSNSTISSQEKSYIKHAIETITGEEYQPTSEVLSESSTQRRTGNNYITITKPKDSQGSENLEGSEIATPNKVEKESSESSDLDTILEETISSKSTKIISEDDSNSDKVKTEKTTTSENIISISEDNDTVCANTKDKSKYSKKLTGNMSKDKDKNLNEVNFNFNDTKIQDKSNKTTSQDGVKESETTDELSITSKDTVKEPEITDELSVTSKDEVKTAKTTDELTTTSPGEAKALKTEDNNTKDEKIEIFRKELTDLLGKFNTDMNISDIDITWEFAGKIKFSLNGKEAEYIKTPNGAKITTQLNEHSSSIMEFDNEKNLVSKTVSGFHVNGKLPNKKYPFEIISLYKPGEKQPYMETSTSQKDGITYIKRTSKRMDGSIMISEKECNESYLKTDKPKFQNVKYDDEGRLQEAEYVYMQDNGKQTAKHKITIKH